MSKFKEGNKVQISNKSIYAYQGLNSDGEKMRGVINRPDSSGWWRVTWDNGDTNTYRDEDLEPYVTTSTSEPEENITFTINGRTYNYTLCSTYYSYSSSGNDVIFNELGVDKDLFCSKVYGYEALYGSWPEWRDGDNEAPIKIVKAIREKIKERESMSKSESTTEQTLLKEARRLYPIGTKYHPIWSDGIKCFGDNIKESTYECRWVESGLGIDCGIGYVYANGKWAEIVGETKVEPSDKELLEEASRRYPIGTLYKELNDEGEVTGALREASEDANWVVRGESIEVGFGYVYVNGKWAEIVSETKAEPIDKEDILEEAKRRYPSGTRYRPIDRFGNTYSETYLSQTYCRWLKTDDGKEIGIECGIGYVYVDGKWAEIVSETKTEPTTTWDLSICYSGGTITSSNITIGRSAFDGSMVYREVTKQLPETQEPIIISKKEKKKKILVL